MLRIAIIWTALVLGCQNEPQTETRQERNEAVFIYANNLAADGCEEMVKLQADSLLNKFTGYKPTPSTLPLLQQALKDIPSTPRGVTMRFFETGKQVQLQCGWGSRPEVPEIEILEIKPR